MDYCLGVGVGCASGLWSAGLGRCGRSATAGFVTGDCEASSAGGGGGNLDMHGFRVAMAVTAGLVAFGGVIGLVGIRNRPISAEVASGETAQT